MAPLNSSYLCLPVTNTRNAATTASVRPVKHKRRYCRTHGCTRIVKSQGLCQRHGAKPRKCRVENCTKQAQGNFDGMCKAHFKSHYRTDAPVVARQTNSKNPVSESDVDKVKNSVEQIETAVDNEIALTVKDFPTPPIPAAADNLSSNAEIGVSVYTDILPASIAWSAGDTDEYGVPVEMPLIAFLRDGVDKRKPIGWHRNEERLARGIPVVTNPATQLEGWERELVWMEVLVLTGNPDSCFRHLAHGWGRHKGFHMVLAQFICERHGNVERKHTVRKNRHPASSREQQTIEVQSEGANANYQSHHYSQVPRPMQDGSYAHHNYDPMEPLPIDHTNTHSNHNNNNNNNGHHNNNNNNNGGVWEDSGDYYNQAYNEELAAELFEFSTLSFPPGNQRQYTEMLFMDTEDSSSSSAGATEDRDSASNSSSDSHAASA